ncbi:helix-turn-helix domain-containing protein [Nocardia sp. 004]|uniref:helix-turn-helix domain-containing protein n=1 Tax=Nocardia sp. 004 TaxID=3385978 RepID=UPI00399FD690
MAVYLRTHRRRAGLTLEALAERTGSTKSYLSKVERGLSTPSIAVALKIADALNTDVGQLFSDTPDPALMQVGRADEHAPDLSAPAADYHALATKVVGKAMQPFLVRPAVGQPNADEGEDHLAHTGDEFIFVHSGAVEVTVPGEVITLRQGDSFYFAATTPHRIRSISPERAQLVVIVAERQPGAGGVAGSGIPGPR